MKGTTVNVPRIIRLTVGQMAENCYIVAGGEKNEVLIIDPGDEAQFVAQHITDLHVTPVAIIATHGHFDHILAAFELQMLYHIPFRIHASDGFLVDRMRETAEYFLGHKVVEPAPKITSVLENGEKIAVGNSILEVIPTPGHTPGSVCLYLKDAATLFVGDTIFASGGVGRTDFSYSEPLKLADSIKMIFTLPAKIRLLPGHGEETTVDKEKRFHESTD